MRRAALILMALLMIGGALGVTVGAQESGVRPPPPDIDVCPDDLACVEYEEAVLEIDPACGPVQAFVVEESLARTIDLHGTTEAYGVLAVVVIQDGASYRIVGTFSQPATGALDGVRFGHVGCLVFEGGADE